MCVYVYVCVCVFVYVCVCARAREYINMRCAFVVQCVHVNEGLLDYPTFYSKRTHSLTYYRTHSIVREHILILCVHVNEGILDYPTLTIVREHIL